MELKYGILGITFVIGLFGLIDYIDETDGDYGYY